MSELTFRSPAILWNIMIECKILEALEGYGAPNFTDHYIMIILIICASLGIQFSKMTKIEKIIYTRYSILHFVIQYIILQALQGIGAPHFTDHFITMILRICARLVLQFFKMQKIEKVIYTWYLTNTLFARTFV